ncbi:helix-turn-helix domain-containing protein [Burkholderia cepacia]|uniref:AlbA family DNA-binding domain-containing protein n=1 Tax=Burkholderia cepacia TaxID=292 RepID=UPI0009C07E49|nr:ATP-binding protein [Burkholderia cepacia]
MIPRARVNEIAEADIQHLIDQGIRESRTLDYKQDWPGDRDARVELAKDVCAFANTLGGDLVFGIREEAGAAAEVTALSLANVDSELLTVVNAVRDLLEPRVSGGLHVHPVPLAAGGFVIVLRIAPSPSAPHRVTRDNHFYGRNSVGKAPMDIYEIRNAFAMHATLAKQVRAFRDEALDRLEQGEGPSAQLDFPACVCHVVPVSALTRPDAHIVDALLGAAANLLTASPSNRALGRPRVNLYGVVCNADRNQHERETAYAQLYRDGSVELVDGALLRRVAAQQQGETLHAVYPDLYELPLVRSGFRAIGDTLAALDVPGPAYLMLSWLFGRGTVIGYPAGRWQGDRFVPLPGHLTRLTAPPIFIEDFTGAPREILLPAFDVLWNAIGVPHTQTDFDA